MLLENKNLILGILLTSVVLLMVLAPQLVSAQDPFNPDIGGTPTSPITSEGAFFDFLGRVFGFLYYLFFAAAAFMFLYAGFIYLTAADDVDKVSKASKILIYGFIAVVVAVVSVGLAFVIEGMVQG